MLKKELRKKYNTQRLQLSAAERARFNDLLLIQFQQAPLPPLHHIMSFVPIEGKREVNTFLLTDFLRFRNPGLQLCYPKTNIFQNTMQAISTDESTEFDANEYGVPEPVQGPTLEPQLLDLVLVPLLIFDTRGYRVGYGKGFYDRFLKDCRTDCIKIGLSYFEPVTRIDDTSGFDVPLNYCITPQTVYVF